MPLERSQRNERGHALGSRLERRKRIDHDTNTSRNKSGNCTTAPQQLQHRRHAKTITVHKNRDDPRWNTPVRR